MDLLEGDERLEGLLQFMGTSLAKLKGQVDDLRRFNMEPHLIQIPKVKLFGIDVAFADIPESRVLAIKLDTEGPPE